MRSPPSCKAIATCWPGRRGEAAARCRTAATASSKPPSTCWPRTPPCERDWVRPGGRTSKRTTSGTTCSAGTSASWRLRLDDPVVGRDRLDQRLGTGGDTAPHLELQQQGHRGHRHEGTADDRHLDPEQE